MRPIRNLELYGAHWLTHRIGALHQGIALLSRKIDLNDFLEPTPTEFAWHAEEKTGHPVLAFQPRCTRKNALLVVNDRLTHLNRCCRWRIVGGSRLQVLHDFGTTATRAVDDCIQLRLCHQLSHRNAADGGVEDEGDHGVAVTAEHHRLNVT